MAVVPIINQQLDGIEQAIRELAGTYNFGNYVEIVSALRAGRNVPNGIIFKVTHDTYGDIWFVTRAKNQHKVAGDATRPTVTIQALYLVPSTTAATASLNLQYDRPEAMCKVTEVIPAGTVVKFTSIAYGGWTADTWNFTAQNTIPVGSMLCLNKYQDTPLANTSVVVYDSPTDTTASQTLLISSGDGDATVNLGTWGTELNHPHRISYGSNNDAESNLFFWLNLVGAVDTYWSQKTKYDMLGSWYKGKQGFLGGFPEDFRNCLGLCSVPNVTNNVFESQDSAYTKGTAYNYNGYFFLPSRKEIYGSNEYAAEADETHFDYYKDIGTTDADKLMFAQNAVSPTTYWLRTPYASGAGGVRVCSTGSGGALSYDYADGSHALAPLAILT